MFRFLPPLLFLLVVTAALLFPSLGCTNELEKFCEDTTAEMCARCYACAPNEAQAAALCGLEVATDEAGCRDVLMIVCRSDDSAFAVSGGRSCRDAIEKMTCEQLNDDGKPRFCARLF